MKKKINLEWLRIPIDYIKVSDDIRTVVKLPIVISILTSILYYLFNDTVHALKVFSELLLNLDSILIGFTGILVTLLLTTENKTIDILKAKKTDKKLYIKKFKMKI